MTASSETIGEVSMSCDSSTLPMIYMIRNNNLDIRIRTSIAERLEGMTTEEFWEDLGLLTPVLSEISLPRLPLDIPTVIRQHLPLLNRLNRCSSDKRGLRIPNMA